MTEQIGASNLPNPSECGESPDDYLKRAARACESGDLVLGMHLYLAAYEKAAADPDIPDGMALTGLQEAWSLACSLKERSMAEYIYEKLEPFLTADEVSEYAHELQDLALDRLEQYGFSREDLADMAEMISQDLLDGRASIVKVESMTLPCPDASESLAELALEEGTDTARPGGDSRTTPSGSNGDSEDDRIFDQVSSDSLVAKKPGQVGIGVAGVGDFNPYDLYNTSSVGASYHAATNDGSGAYVFSRDEERIAESAESGNAHLSAQGSSERRPSITDRNSADSSVPAVDEMPGDAVSGADDERGSEDGAQAPGAPEARSDAPANGGTASAVPAPGKTQVQAQVTRPVSAASNGSDSAFSYRQLVGYDEAVSVMRDFGIGMHRDGAFKNFIAMMNARHGLTRMPSLDTMLFRAPVIEDAARFLEATIGEIGLPVLRMSMEEGVQGLPLLCISTQGNSRPRMNHSHNRFEGPGILVIEDLDMWAFPEPPEGMEGFGGFMMANISRAAREAIGLIESAVADPDVCVLVTATTQGDVDSYFYDLLEPLTVIDIGNPTEAERDAVWSEIMNDHPSMRLLSRSNLTRLSAGLSRYDMYVAAREAIEEAYKAGLVQRSFVPVVEQNIYGKLAACQPLESDEYRVIEDEVARAFRDELEKLDDFIDGVRS